MKKTTKQLFRKKCYLLGKDHEGINYWLEEPSWDCDWYYGFGYIESYTNNRCPEKSRDIQSHQHFDSLFLKGPKDAFTMFKDFFKETVLTDSEIYLLVDYMMSAYTLRKTSDLLHQGCSWQTERAKLDEVKQPEMYNKINKEMLPAIFKEIDKLLSPVE